MRMKDFSKAYERQYHKLYEMVYSSDSKSPSRFLSELKRIATLFNLPTFDYVPIDPAKYPNNYENLHAFRRKKFRLFFKKASHSTRASFMSEIEVSRKKLKLGREWSGTLIDAALSGVFSPPPFAVFYEEDEEGGIVFETNKDTTKLDLDLAWEATEDLRKKLFGRKRAAYVTAKTRDNFKILAKATVEKYADSVSKKKTDMAVVANIYQGDDISSEADIRRVNRVKIMRRRQKKRLN